MGSPQPRKRRNRWLAGVPLIALLAVALFATLYRPPAELSAKVLASAVRFVYHPETAGNEVPLLAGESFDGLSIRSFDTLTAASGVMSIRTTPTDEWTVVPGPVVIAGDEDDPAKAIFKRATIKSWDFERDPDVALGIPEGESTLHLVFEGTNIALMFDAGDPVEFECQSCRIEGENSATPKREIRLSGLKQSDLKASSRSTLILDATPGPNGFRNQQFSMSRPRFCGGRGEARSTLLRGEIKFPETGRDRKLEPASANRPSSVLRVNGDEKFSVIALRLVDENKRRALDLQFDGPATSAELASDCTAAGSAFQPTYAEMVARHRIVAPLYASFVLLCAWVALYDQVKKLWARTASDEARK